MAGTRAGVAAAVLSAPVNLTLLALAGSLGVSPFLEAVLPVSAGMAYLAGTIGWLRDRQRREYDRRLEAEAASRVSEERFRAMFTASRVGTALLNLEGIVIDCNPALSNMLGYPVEEIRGSRLAALMVPAAGDQRPPESWIQPPATASSCQFRHRSGRLILGQMTTSAVGDDRGSPSHRLFMVEDRTESRLAELALQRGVEEKAALAEIGRIVSSSLDLRQVFPRFAGQVRRLIEFDRIVITAIDAAANKTVDVCVHGVEVTGYEQGRAHRFAGAVLERAVTTRRPYVIGEHPGGVVPDAESVMASTRAAGLHSTMVAPLISNDEVIGTLNLKSTRRDAYGENELAVIERIASQIAGAVAASQLYAKAVQLGEERELRARLEAEKRELERVSEAKSEFLSTVSHELKTPLATILGFADVLARNRAGNLVQKQVEQLGLIQRNGRRLGVLINDLVDVSSIVAGRFDIEPSEFDALELLREVAGSFGPIVEAKNQTLAVRFPESPVWMSADRDRLAQVMSNLLDNASKYSPIGAQIDFESEPDGSRLAVLVRDHGSGIPSSDQGRLFTSFFRAGNEATRSVPGTGLGLAICKRIIDLHGGSIAFESAEGAGTTMRFQVPGVIPHVPQPPHESSADDQGRALGRLSVNEVLAR